MRHLGEFLVVAQQLVGFELPFLSNGLVLLYVDPFWEFMDEMVVKQLHMSHL